MAAPAGPFIGKSTSLSTSVDGVTYTAYAKLVDIKPPAPKFADVETTGYDSVIEDFIPGWENAGEAEFKINFDATQSNAIYALLGVTKQYWKIQLPDGTGPTTGTTIVFQGYVNHFGPEIPLKQRISTDVKIKVQSKPVITVAT